MSKRPFTIGEELKKAGVPGMDTDREQIEYMDLDKILPDPENFYSLDGIEELAANIELIGLQQPLRVRDVGRGYVMVVSGHRRRAACLAIRDGGNPMFDKGVAIIRERGDVSKEWQELKLIYGNSATRILTASEISIQSEKVTEILGKLEEQGVKFPGRTRDHVAAILQTSKSRVGRLHAIRANLVPELLQEFDGGGLGETVAYRLSQEEATVQHDLAARLGPAVRGLTGDSAEKVLGQIKQPLVKEPEKETDCHANAAALARNDGAATGSAIDGLKKYLDEREKEDDLYFEMLCDVAGVFLPCISGVSSRREGIETLKQKHGSIYHGGSGEGKYCWFFDAEPKGLKLEAKRGPKILRTWTEVYDLLCTIALSRAALVDERNKRNVKPKDVPAVGTKPTWQTGPAPGPGRYLCRVDMDGSVHECTCEYRDGGRWMAYGRHLDSSFKVLGWWPLPEK